MLEAQNAEGFGISVPGSVMGKCLDVDSDVTQSGKRQNEGTALMIFGQ